MGNNKESYMIANLFYDEDTIKVEYYDGKEEEEPFSAHNLHFYRNRWMSQLNETCKLELNLFYNMESKILRHFIWGSLRHVLEIFLTCNLDIHIIMRIILIALILLLQHRLTMISASCVGTLDIPKKRMKTLLMYMNNASLFEYKGNDQEYHYLVAIDDVVNKFLTYDLVEILVQKLYSEKKQKNDIDGINLPFLEERDKKVEKLNSTLGHIVTNEVDYANYMYSCCEFIDEDIINKGIVKKI